MTSTPTAPRTFLCDGARLLQVREAVRNDDAFFRPAFFKLVERAEAALSLGPWSVMDKARTPPSGDKHDYYSPGIYWWPNPDTPDGLPYVRRDGEVNPTSAQGDKVPLEQMTAAVDALALAGFFTGEARYSERAALLVRTWFLDPATRMNPSVKYAHSIPGVHEGSHWGIVDTSLQFPTLIDAVGVLEASDAWTDADRAASREWFGAYLDWLESSEYGQAEAKEPGNHGSRYDVHAVSVALFAGRDDVARRILNDVPAHCMEHEIAPDGSLPVELVRTRSLIYSTAHLLALMNLATMAAPLGIDLWNSQTADGRDIRLVLDYLAPAYVNFLTWPHEEITPPEPGFGLDVLRRAALAYGDEHYEHLIAQLPAEAVARSRQTLLYPPASFTTD